MRVLYISGPYRVPNGVYGPFTPHQLERNIRKAQHWAELGWQLGWAVICPHMNTRGMDGLPSVASATFINGDKEFLRRMRPDHDAILMMPTWELSAGAGLEHDLAVERGLRVIYAVDDTSLINATNMLPGADPEEREADAEALGDDTVWGEPTNEP